MPSKSKAQQRFMGLVHAYKKGEVKGSEVSKAVKDAAKSMKKKSTKKYASTKHTDLPNKVKEERDYKAEYKKFQSSTKAKKYRAELNQYNRKKGTYGNGDGKDASHKGGKIVGFEAESKNRGRAEKSRLKRETLQKLVTKYGAKKVRETIIAVRPKAVTVKGYRMPEEPDFEYDPEKVTDEGFGGELKGKDKDKFEKARKENAEQLGYKATGTSDTKKQKLKMAHELKEGTCGYGVDGKLGDKPAGPHLLKAKKKKKLEKEVNNPTAGIMMARKSNTDFLKKIVSQLKNSSKMHGEQAVRIDKFLNSLEESIDEAPITSPSQQPYSSPEAQKMAEKDIIAMSKILGKASQMSIKKMMDGVKSGKYDAFDLQRAIMSGPVRDTHTGERDFMRVLWNKVRSGFRRYSKRGKLR